MQARTLLYPLLALLLAACGSPAASATPVPSPTATSAGPAALPTRTPTPPASAPPVPLEPADLEGVQVRFLHVWTGPRGEWIAAAVARFNSENSYGVTVTAETAQDLDAQVRADLQAGDPPDLVVGFNYHLAGWDDLADLTPYIQDSTWGLSAEARADFFPAFWAEASRGDEQLGLPFYRTAEVLFYNKTWAAELGFDQAPATPEELRSRLCAAQAAQRSDSDVGNDATGGLLLGFQPGPLSAWMFAFGGGIGPTGEDEGYRLDRPENLAAFSFLKGLLDDSCAWVPEADYPHAEFAARLGLALPSTLAGAAAQQAAMDAAGSTDAWVILPYPTESGGQPALVSGPNFAVFDTTPARRLAAWEFARWMTSPENLSSWTELTGYFPVRESVLASAPEYIKEADWIALGVSYPPIRSWPQVQWAVSDVARVLFAPLFGAEEIPGLARELDLLAEEIHAAHH